MRPTVRVGATGSRRLSLRLCIALHTCESIPSKFSYIGLLASPLARWACFEAGSEESALEYLSATMAETRPLVVASPV